MHTFKRLPPRLKWYQGIGLLALVILVLLLASVVTRVLDLFLPAIVSMLLFYLFGILVALFVLRRFIMGYSYILTGTLLRVSHCYSKHERVITDVYHSTLVALGTEEEMRKRYKDAKIIRAVLATDPAQVTAVAYRNGKRIEILLIQPDDRIRDYLVKTLREK